MVTLFCHGSYYYFLELLLWKARVINSTFNYCIIQKASVISTPFINCWYCRPGSWTHSRPLKSQTLAKGLGHGQTLKLSTSLNSSNCKPGQIKITFKISLTVDTVDLSHGKCKTMSSNSLHPTAQCTVQAWVIDTHSFFLDRSVSRPL